MCKFKPECVASKSHPHCSCQLSSKIERESATQFENIRIRRAVQVCGIGNRFDPVGNPQQDLLES